MNQYKNISFEISLKELDDINKHISVLKVLVNDFQKWIEKKPRKRTKKITKKFSVKKFKKWFRKYSYKYLWILNAYI